MFFRKRSLHLELLGFKRKTNGQSWTSRKRTAAPSKKLVFAGAFFFIFWLILPLFHVAHTISETSLTSFAITCFAPALWIDSESGAEQNLAEVATDYVLGRGSYAIGAALLGDGDDGRPPPLEPSIFRRMLIFAGVCYLILVYGYWHQFSGNLLCRSYQIMCGTQQPAAN